MNFIEEIFEDIFGHDEKQLQQQIAVQDQHQHVVAAPEMNGSSAVIALTMLAMMLAIVTGRRKIVAR